MCVSIYYEAVSLEVTVTAFTKSYIHFANLKIHIPIITITPITDIW